ncbi:MAG: carboxylesterase family protein [Bacteroidota bacterium]
MDAAIEEVKLELDKGPIRGYRQEGVAVFKGIPYAQPPIGKLRWKPPQKLAPWQEIKNCQDFGPVCPQAEYPKTSIYRISPRPQSEDCLYLNVWSSSLDASAKLPVMVWIHGGNLERGSSCLPFYNGINLSKEEVVMVSINYRVGILGFLAHPELSAESERGISGNYALLDQIAALEWVKENIHHFGGDKDRVCIFGQSAGSWSVNTLMASPLAKGLFHRVIGMSGASFYGERYLKENRSNKVSAESLGQKFMQKMGASNLAELRETSAENLVKAAFSEEILFKSEFVVDGYALPSTVKEIFEQGRHNQVPLMLGLTAREWSGFVDLKSLPRDLTSYKEMLEKRYPGKWELFSKVYPAESDKDILGSHLDHWGDLVFGGADQKMGKGSCKD